MTPDRKSVGGYLLNAKYPICANFFRGTRRPMGRNVMKIIINLQG